MDVDVNPKMQGFLACFNHSTDYDAGMFAEISKKVSWRISGEPVAGQPKNINADYLPDRFFENDQYVYNRAN